MNSLGDISQGNATATAAQFSASTLLVMAASVEEEMAIIRSRMAFIEAGRPSSSAATHVKRTAPSQAARALDTCLAPIDAHFEGAAVFEDYCDAEPLHDYWCDTGPVFDDCVDEGPLFDDFDDEGPLFDDFDDGGPLFDDLGSEALLCGAYGANGPLSPLEAPSLLVDTHLSPTPPFSLRHPLPPPLRLPFFVDFDALLQPPTRDMVPTPSPPETEPSGIPPLMVFPESCDQASSPPTREIRCHSSCFTPMPFRCSHLVGKRPHSTFVFKKGRAHVSLTSYREARTLRI